MLVNGWEGGDFRNDFEADCGMLVGTLRRVEARVVRSDLILQISRCLANPMNGIGLHSTEGVKMPCGNWMIGEPCDQLMARLRKERVGTRLRPPEAASKQIARTLDELWIH